VELAAARHILNGARRRRMQPQWRFMMKRSLLTAAAALVLSSGAVLAAGTSQYQPPAPNTYSGGYVFPEYGTPPDEQPMAQQPGGIGRLRFSHVYLYPPAEGNDSGENGS
jgi:hypothetical protein